MEIERDILSPLHLDHHGSCRDVTIISSIHHVTSSPKPWKIRSGGVTRSTVLATHFNSQSPISLLNFILCTLTLDPKDIIISHIQGILITPNPPSSTLSWSFTRFGITPGCGRRAGLRVIEELFTSTISVQLLRTLINMLSCSPAHFLRASIQI